MPFFTVRRAVRCSWRATCRNVRFVKLTVTYPSRSKIIESQPARAAPAPAPAPTHCIVRTTQTSITGPSVWPDTHRRKHSGRQHAEDHPGYLPNGQRPERPAEYGSEHPALPGSKGYADSQLPHAPAHCVRLPRWLLMAQDMTGTDVLDLTQEFLAMMLGTRRTTVTMIAGTLQRSGLIEYHRGRVSIPNREILKPQRATAIGW
jgi:hypothetical protein